MEGLALAGGGAFGAYEVGAIKALTEAGVRFDAYAGTSIGAACASILAQYGDGREHLGAAHLEGLWMGLRTNRIMRHWWVGRLAALWRPSAYSSAPGRRLIRQNVDPFLLQSSGKLLRVLSTDLVTGDQIEGTEQSPDIIDHVIASGAFPGILEPHDISGRAAIDGGIRDNIPIRPLLRLGCTRITVVIPSPEKIDKGPASGNALDLAARAIDILMNELATDDLRICKSLDVPLRIIRPARSLPGGLFDFHPRITSPNVSAGYSETLRVLHLES